MTDAPDIKRCPMGHVVGSAFGTGSRCSGRTCGKVRAQELALKKATEMLKNPPPPPTPVGRMGEEETAIQNRFKLAQLPADGNVDDPVAWSKDSLAKMLPEAVAQLKWDLRKGTDKVRSEAAEKVLRANGMDKREAVQQERQPTIILNIGTDSKAPWLERLKKDKLP